MSDSEESNFSDEFKHWAEQMDRHQYQIIVETNKIVDLLKQKKVSAKTKNELIIVVRGLQATAKSVAKVLSKYTE